jgi:hypothetical protein
LVPPAKPLPALTPRAVACPRKLQLEKAIEHPKTARQSLKRKSRTVKTKEQYYLENDAPPILEPKKSI